jgi:RNA polymerase sigma factor (sigma-70 family)
MTDASIIARSLEQPAVFAELFDRHADDVYRFAARRLGVELAEDLLSETFVVAFQKRRRYDVSRADARPWLLGIITNLARRHRRAEARRWRAIARTRITPEPEPMADRVVARVAARLCAPTSPRRWRPCRLAIATFCS